MRTKLSAWLALSRLPFHSVGVLPYALGAVLGWKLEERFRWDVFGIGTFGVVLVMLATYLAGEYWDFAEDSISGEMGRSRFAGGSGVLQEGLVRRRTVLWASIGCVAMALGVGVVLVLLFGVGAWALLFGAVGLLAGFFYSTRPIRWVRTGWGELWIAFCYGWLPVAVGSYLQVDTIRPTVHWVAVPVGLTIFNVILLNEFPDHFADCSAGKRNIAVRVGLKGAARLYAIVSALSWGATLLAISQGTRVPALVLWLYLPILALSAALTLSMLREAWRERRTLEKLCGANLLVNLGTTGAFLLGFVFGT